MACLRATFLFTGLWIRYASMIWLTHRVVGVHRRQRVLKDHRHPLSAQAADVLRSLAQQFLAVEIDLTAQLRPGPRLLRSRPGVQAHDRQAGDALARTGLAHNAEGPATVQCETQPVDRLHQPVVGREVHPKINDLQERLLSSACPDAGVTMVSRSVEIGMSFEPHPRIDDAVQKINEQVRHDHKEAGDQGDAEDLRQVAC